MSLVAASTLLGALTTLVPSPASAANQAPDPFQADPVADSTAAAKAATKQIRADKQKAKAKGQTVRVQRLKAAQAKVKKALSVLGKIGGAK